MRLQFEETTQGLPKLHTWKCFGQLFSLKQLFSTGLNHHLPVTGSPWETADSSNWLNQSFGQTLLPICTEVFGKKKWSENTLGISEAFLPTCGRSLKIYGFGAKENIFKVFAYKLFFFFISTLHLVITVSFMKQWLSLNYHDKVVWSNMNNSVQSCQPEIVASMAITIFKGRVLVPRNYTHPH